MLPAVILIPLLSAVISHALLSLVISVIVWEFIYIHSPVLAVYVVSEMTISAFVVQYGTRLYTRSE